MLKKAKITKAIVSMAWVSWSLPLPHMDYNDEGCWLVALNSKFNSYLTNLTYLIILISLIWKENHYLNRK